MTRHCETCSCGCGQRTVPGRKYIKGHRPLKLTAQGYRRVWRPGHALADKYGMALEHRVIAWEAGLLTDPSLHVHHRNGDRTDNRVENLEVVTNSDHARHHIRERRTVRNQFGTFPVVTDPSERKAREKRHNDQQARRRFLAGVGDCGDVRAEVTA